MIKFQDEIAAAIAVALDVALALNSARLMVDPIAYELYLRTLRPTFAPEDFASDIGLLEEATRRAPEFAAAWGRLAVQRVRALLFRPLVERPALQREAVAAADRALQLDPKSGTAYLALYWLEPPLARWLERQRLLEKALADPASGNLAWFMRALFLAQVGRFSDAIDCAWEGYARDRADPGASNQPGWILVRAGRFREARPLLEAVLARWPEAYYAATNLILACAYEDDWNAVDRLIDPERLAKFPLREFTIDTRLRRPSSQSFTGIARATHVVCASTFRTIRAHRYSTPYERGLFLFDRRRLSKSLQKRILGRLATRQTGSVRYSTGARRCFNIPIRRVRRDPRFASLCARLGLVEYWTKTGHWPDCVEEVAPYYDFKAECEKVAARGCESMSDAMRKIAVIVALDVAGYSARTEADEARTTAEVAALRGVIEGIAARHAGRVFNTAGDGFMLEFGSSLGAVEAAFELAEKCEPKVRVGRASGRCGGAAERRSARARGERRGAVDGAGDAGLGAGVGGRAAHDPRAGGRAAGIARAA